MSHNIFPGFYKAELCQRGRMHASALFSIKNIISFFYQFLYKWCNAHSNIESLNCRELFDLNYSFKCCNWHVFSWHANEMKFVMEIDKQLLGYLINITGTVVYIVIIFIALFVKEHHWKNLSWPRGNLNLRRWFQSTTQVPDSTFPREGFSIMFHDKINNINIGLSLWLLICLCLSYSRIGVKCFLPLYIHLFLLFYFCPFI